MEHSNKFRSLNIPPISSPIKKRETLDKWLHRLMWNLDQILILKYLNTVCPECGLPCHLYQLVYDGEWTGEGSNIKCEYCKSEETVDFLYSILGLIGRI